MAETFSAREVAELADVPIRAVDKAVEEKVLTGVRHVKGTGRRRRMLPLHAIPYAAIISKLPVTLTRADKRRMARALGARPVARMTAEPLEIAPGLSLDVPRLVGGKLAERAAGYGRARREHIEVNPEILGGTPVIRGTRMTVYAIRGRLDHGDTVEDILMDNPHLTREAVETASLYARTHPLAGRPSGRPWAKSA